MLRDEIVIPPISEQDVMIVCDSLFLDNPIIFYVSSYYCLYESNREVVAIHPVYQFSKQDILRNIDSIYSYLKQFDSIKSMDDYGKELFIHDFCLKQMKYDYTFCKSSFSVIGPIIHKIAVCEGISKLVKLIFDYTGIRCIVVEGRVTNPMTGIIEAHAWNVVEIFGQFYHLDVTFDLTLTNEQNRYDYFNLSDNEIKRDHIIKGYTPPCISMNHNFFIRNSLQMNSLQDLKNFFTHSFNQRRTSLLFRADFSHNDGDIGNLIIDTVKRMPMPIYRKNCQMELRANKNQMVYEINFIV